MLITISGLFFHVRQCRGIQLVRNQNKTVVSFGVNLVIVCRAWTWPRVWCICWLWEERSRRGRWINSHHSWPPSQTKAHSDHMRRQESFSDSVQGKLNTLPACLISSVPTW